MGTVDRCFENAEQYRTIRTVLADIPAEASVSSNGFYLPTVSARREVYDIMWNRRGDYVVLDLRPSFGNNAAEDETLAADDRYVCETYIEELIAVYRRKGD